MDSPAPLSTQKSCGEADYNANLRQYFGTLTYLTTKFDAPGYDAEIWWSSQGNGNYAAFFGLWSAGTDVPSVERNLGDKGCGLCGGTMMGNPVNISNGNKYEDELDYQSQGQFPLTFHRYYNSASFGGDGTIGVQWTHTFSRSLTLQSSAEVKLFRDDGGIQYFYQCGNLWCPTLDETGTLIKNVDSNGHALSWQYTDEHEVIEIYNVDGTLHSETNRNGLRHVLVYDGIDRLSTITDSSGRQLILTYNSANQVAQLQTPDGEITTYAYDTSGNLSSVTYPGNTTRTYFYNESGDVGSGAGPNLLTGIQDEVGQRFATFQYDGQSRATVSEHANGAGLIQLTYNANGSTAVLDASGGSKTYAFQTVQNVNHTSTVNGPACANCGINSNYAYNPAGDLTSVVDFNGNTTLYSIDTAHLEESRVEASGSNVQRTISTQWNIPLRVPLTRTVSDVNGNVTRSVGWVYNSAGQPLARCDIDPSQAAGYICATTGTPPAGVRRWTFSYCTAVDTTQCPIVGLLLSVDGPRTDVADVTTYAYYLTDSATSHHGDLQSATDALGHTTTYLTYDGAGRVTSLRDANGVVTNLTYTPRGWLASRSVGGATTTLSYTPYGAVASLTDPDGIMTSYTYDAAHRLTDITDVQGNVIHYTLDAAGNRVGEAIIGFGGVIDRGLGRMYNSKGRQTSLMDGLNHVVLSATFPDSYDANGNLMHTADGAWVEHEYGYDALNRLVSAIDNYNGVDTATGNTQALITYDALDRVEGVSDPDGLVTTYDYDGLGNRTALHSPDTGTSSDTYDAAGNRLTHTDAKGIVSTSTYDADNRLASTGYTDITLNVSYAYDEANAVTGCSASSPIGLLTRVVEAGVATVFCYDGRGNVIQKRQVTSSQTDTVLYAYTAGDRLSSVSTPDQTAISYAYDSNGRVNGVQVTPSGTTAAPPTVFSGISYVPFGPISSYLLGSGQVINRAYNGNYAATDVMSPALALHFDYDNMGNIKALRDARTSPVKNTYLYDPLNRLATVKDSSGGVLEAYTYSKTGDRLSKTAPGLATGAYLYTSGAHQLASVGGISRANDVNGNTTGSVIGGNTYGFGYNGRNRLTVTQLNGATVGTYTYNALGQRIGKVATFPQAVTERYAYNEAGQLIGEYGTSNRDYVWVGDLLVAVIDNTINGSTTTSAVNYVTVDQLGTPRVVTDGTGTVIWSWAYQDNPFGEQQPTSTMGYVLNLRYPGQYYDAESGTNYNVNRNYNPPLGRYDQPDPMGQAAGPSLFGYVGSNPLSYVDPYGLSSLIFNPSTRTLTVVNGAGQALEDFPAGNNAQRSSRGPWPQGTYDYGYWMSHAGDGLNSPYGSYGNNVFDVPGCSGCGVHSGRANSTDLAGRSGVNFATNGCIRTTDDATGLIRQLANAGDPLSGLTVTSNPPPTNLPPIDLSLPGGPTVYLPDTRP
jgi:RHS repeat-associated protein